jgi:predicted flap endonuclease-1-like 5' DNA nuclease
MPDFSATDIVLLVALAAVGAIAGWFLRGRQAEREKAAVSAGWQEQIKAQRKESQRLIDQNKSLMEQVSQFQAQHTDATNRAKELSLAVQEAFARRDELQREIKDVRSSLDTVLSERDQLASDMQARESDADVMRRKDEYIGKLSRELENWQSRLPPLIERYRLRNEEAEEAEIELEAARARILELEEALPGDGEVQTRIEAVHDPEELMDGLDASNDAERGTEINEGFAEDDGGGLRDEDLDEEPDDEVLVNGESSAEDSVILTDAVAAELESGPREQRDDLKMIKGVGPAIEKTLNEMGIFSFQQIADLSEYDIDRVARRLKGFHSRIHREDWIGQARMLLDRAAHA